MLCKRIGVVLFGVGVALGTLSCGDITHPLDPEGPQYAKGGKPGKPSDPVPVDLKEYFVYQIGGENFVHILAEGTFPRVNLNVVQDYFHDGIRNNDLFYEYTTAAPAPVGPGDPLAGLVWEEVGPGTGIWHIDLPFDGKGGFGYPEKQYVEFPDFPPFNTSGPIPDPFTFDVRFQAEDGSYIDGFRPEGIILESDEIGEVSVDLGTHPYHDGMTVSSYASYTSSRPGHPVFIQDIIVDETSLSCNLKNTRTGTGKDKVTNVVTEVSVGAQVILSAGASGESVAPGWITVMFVTGDPQNPTLHGTAATTHGSDAWATGWGAGAQLPLDARNHEIRFAVIYVYAKDLEHGDVYDASGNRGGGVADPAASWFTVLDPSIDQEDLAGPLLGSFPIAMTAPLNLDCGG